MRSYKKANQGFVAMAVCALLLTGSAWAQDAGQPGWLDVVVIQVKGGMALDFEDRVRELQAARAAADMPPMLIASVARGHPNEYHLVSEVPSLEQANSAPPPMEPAEFAAWVARITSAVDSVHFFYAMTYPQHGIEGNQGGQAPQLLSLRKTRVVSGKQEEYEDWIANEFMPAFRQTNPLGHTMSRGVLGDSDQHFYHAVPVANWAAFDAGDPLAEVLGERRMAQMLDGLDGIVESSEVIVLTLRNDLMGAGQD